MPVPDSGKVQALIDRQEIFDCLTRYARGVDRLDAELILSAYHADANDDHGVFVGSPRDFVDWVIDLHRTGQSKTMHLLGNHRCELVGDTAHCETYCVYYGYNRNDTIDVCANRYIDRFEKRGGEWRIADRICVVEWLANLTVADLEKSVVGPLQAELMSNAKTGRDHGDVSYARPLKVVRQKKIPPRIGKS